MVNDGEALDTYIEQSEMQLLDTRATEIDNAISYHREFHYYFICIGSNTA